MIRLRRPASLSFFCHQFALPLRTSIRVLRSGRRAGHVEPVLELQGRLADRSVLHDGHEFDDPGALPSLPGLDAGLGLAGPDASIKVGSETLATFGRAVTRE